jgi:ABC-type antimicrobial peptide transport system permease subunit
MIGVGIVRNTLAGLLLAGHIGAIFLLFFRLGSYFETDEVVQIILMLSPLTGLYATAVVKFYSENADLPPTDLKINAMFAAICLFLCLAFLFAIFYTIYDFPFGTIRTKESFKTVISAIETALGVLLGIVVTKLFPARGAV